MEETNPKKTPSAKLVIPFFVVMGILTVVSFCLPLRPAQSQMERRNLAKFPEFSWTALTDGSYFDDITLWFSDTFPGREGWIRMSTWISGLHGYSEIAFAGDFEDWEEPQQEVMMQATEETTEETAPVEPVEAVTQPTQEGLQETEAPEEIQWGGLDAGEDVKIDLTPGAVIQIGDAAFNAVGFSDINSKNYAAALNSFAKAMEGEGVRVVSAPAPTAVGILIEPQNLAKMRCANQDDIIRFLHDQMDESIVKVDTYAALVPHNDEYIYFRTDHHWTARGAYYAYVGICEALGYEPVPLEACEEWDQGEFEGSLYWKAPYPKKLKRDTLIAYVPKANLELRTRSLSNEGTVRPLIQDMTERSINVKYSAFLFGDNPLVQVTNYDLPDGPVALVIKDSFGNALVPFLAQNYSKVYAMDYRKFGETNLRYFLHVHPVDDVIFAPYVIATQSMDGAKLMNRLCK